MSGGMDTQRSWPNAGLRYENVATHVWLDGDGVFPSRKLTFQEAHDLADAIVDAEKEFGLKPSREQTEAFLHDWGFNLNIGQECRRMIVTSLRKAPRKTLDEGGDDV